MVKTKKAKVHEKLAKKLKRTRTIQETIEQGQRYLGNSTDPPQPQKLQIKRTRTIEETIKTGNLYITQKKPPKLNPNPNPTSSKPT